MEATSSPNDSNNDKNNNGNKVAMNEKEELRMLRTKTHQADFMVLKLERQLEQERNNTLKEKLKRVELEAEVRELKAQFGQQIEELLNTKVEQNIQQKIEDGMKKCEEKMRTFCEQQQTQLNKESQNDVVCVTEANPKQIEEIVNTKLEQNLQQFKAKIEADMGKCERQLHDRSIRNAEAIENHIGKKLDEKNERKIAAAMEKCGRQLRVDYEQALKTSRELHQKIIDQMLAEMNETAADEPANTPSSSTSSNQHLGPPAKRPRRIKPEAADEEEFVQKDAETQPKELQEANSNNNAILEHTIGIAIKEEFEQLKREILEQLNVLATKEELEQQKRWLLSKWSLEHATLAKEQLLEIEKREQSLSAVFQCCLNENIMALKDNMFLNGNLGRLENVVLVRIDGNIFEKMPCRRAEHSRILRAKRPFPISAASAAAATATHPNRRLFYFEVRLKDRIDKNELMFIGMSEAGANFERNAYSFKFEINNRGHCRVAGKEYKRGVEQQQQQQGGFSSGGGGGDVIGCGVLILPPTPPPANNNSSSHRNHLFFTRNGLIWVKPIPVAANDLEKDLFPTIVTWDHQPEVEANFGANMQRCPFLFDDVNKLEVLLIPTRDERGGATK